MCAYGYLDGLLLSTLGEWFSGVVTVELVCVGCWSGVSEGWNEELVAGLVVVVVDVDWVSGITEG